MKTSDMDVRDMLSVLNVVGVEHRIGEVPGVESATVNFAAGLATVRYDETRLNVADIKSAVRQSEYEPAAMAHGGAHEGHAAPDAAPAGLKAGTPQPGKPSPSPAAAKPASVAAPPTAADKPAPEARQVDMEVADKAAMGKA